MERRGPRQPEQRPRAAMGATGNAPAPAGRPALRERLSVRRHLPGPRRALALPHANTEAMQLHLDEISATVAVGAHAVLIFDRAGWHTTGKLDMPDNITPIRLPSRAPELNPVENVCQYLRANCLSNRVFETFDDIIEPICHASNKLTAQPETIASIGRRDWAHVGQPP
jgi:hypothetical protein